MKLEHEYGMSDKLVTVIIPVYNVEDYIRDNIESVVNQTYQQLEIILVDDGSTDASGSICEEYAKKDSRIKVIHKKNAGQSSARNDALDIMTGEYLVFLDSDDYWDLNCIQDMIDQMEQEQADIVCCGCKMIKNGEIEFTINTVPQKTVWSGVDAMFLMLERKGLDSNPWGKLYKAEDWKEVRFQAGKYYEDIPIMYKLLEQSKKVVHIGVCRYNYRLRNDSTTGETFSEKRYAYTEFSKEVYDYIHKCYPEHEREAKTFYMNAVVENFVRLGRIGNKKEFEGYYQELKQEIKTNLTFILRSDYFRKDMKLAVLTNLWGIYKVLRNIKVIMKR